MQSVINQSAELRNQQDGKLNAKRVVGVFAHFAAGTKRVDGQIYRSRLVLSELQARLGTGQVDGVDTGHIVRRPIGTLWRCRKICRRCSDIVIMPNTRGLRWLLPLYLRWQKRYGFRIHFFAVGGWLPVFLRDRPQDVKRLRSCAGIYVQTRRMFDELSNLGVKNLELLPNFRNFATDRQPSTELGNPFRLVYMSRILPEKGPQLAIQAVVEINRQFEETRLVLDLWGPIQKGQEQWFQDTLGDLSAIRYCGVVAPEKIPETLASYDAMLFPTFYSGEGFPGAILDAQIAGLPIIASDWLDNAEFVEVGRTGLLFESRNVSDLKEKIVWMLENPNQVLAMKKMALLSSAQFHVDKIFPPLLRKMGLLGTDDAAVQSIVGNHSSD